MIKPLEQFYCDSCGDLIKDAKYGWFEWLKESVDGKIYNYGFRICHHDKKCMEYANSPNVSDGSLEYFIGNYGFVRLLNFIDIGEVLINSEAYSGPSVKDFREYAEIFRRITIPYYEEARVYWNEADHDGVNENALYMPERLKRIILEFS